MLEKVRIENATRELGGRILWFALFAVFYYSTAFAGIVDFFMKTPPEKWTEERIQNALGALKEFGFTMGMLREFLGFLALNFFLLFLCFLLLLWIGKQMARALRRSETEGRLAGVACGCLFLFAYDQMVFRTDYWNSIYFVSVASILIFLTMGVWKLASGARDFRGAKRGFAGLALFCAFLPCVFSLAIPTIPQYFPGYSLFFVSLFLVVLFLCAHGISVPETRAMGMKWFGVSLLLCLALLFAPVEMKPSGADVMMRLASIFCGAACLFALFRARACFRFRMSLPIACSVCSVCFVSFLFAPWDIFQEDRSGENRGKNIVIIGVDCLSHEMMARANRYDVAPVMEKLMEQGIRYSRAYTIQGRTFPAWVSILSGVSPQEHGGVFNLRNQEKIRKDLLFTFRLRDLGYETIWALDERRFNNMNESYGFDQIVGPKMGLMEFFLQEITRFPVNNILIQFNVSKKLFPYAHGNKGYGTTYNADIFIEEAISAVRKTSKPVFLGIHLESAHYPWDTRYAREVGWDMEVPHPSIRSFLQSMTVVDRQIENLLNGLAREGILNDALVILLSDHGEGFGIREHSIDLERHGLIHEEDWGHGNEVWSDSTNHIILSALRFRNGGIVNAPETHDEQVSLLDIRSAVERFLENDDIHIEAGEPCITVESGLKMSLLTINLNMNLNHLEIIERALPFYRIDQEGLVSLREGEPLKKLLATKDIGVRCRDRVTWFSPKNDRYIAVALDERGLPEKLIPPPSPDDVARISRYMAGYGLKRGGG
ncbi:MAG: sulfatase-like hydrolase/transferase [Candidatus Accumulibacter sp.]|jgi:hypothetical protein|nr:sulfatase-like hydrolase/transferase [Accumulibacter sp.]